MNCHPDPSPPDPSPLCHFSLLFDTGRSVETFPFLFALSKCDAPRRVHNALRFVVDDCRSLRKGKRAKTLLSSEPRSAPITIFAGCRLPSRVPSFSCSHSSPLLRVVLRPTDCVTDIRADPLSPARLTINNTEFGVGPPLKASLSFSARFISRRRSRRALRRRSYSS